MPALTAVETAGSVRSGARSATEIVEECLESIDRANPALNAFVHLDPDGARRAAAEIDRKRASGEDPGPLAGVPFGVKDLEDCRGMPTTYGSLLYKDRPAVEVDSVHVARMRAAGAVPVGKTATPEFGAVALTDTKAWGVTRNPWDTSRTPGGSSGGSAAAVSAGLVPIATASDGGGSIRIPASFCGLVGFKPSFGRIPHPGNQPSTSSVFGIMATTIADAALHLSVVCGPHDTDRFSLPPPTVDYPEAAVTLDVRDLRSLWSPDLGFAVVDPEVAEIAESAASALVSAAELHPVDRPLALTDPVKVWRGTGVLDLFMKMEPGMWPGQAELLTDYVRSMMVSSDQARVPRIAEVWKARSCLDEELSALFSDVDVLLTPTTAVPAFLAEWPMPSEVAGTRVHPAMTVPFTMLANLGWQPAVSLPAGVTSSGLPVGLQVVCRRHADEVVLRLGHIFEQTRPWPRHAPAIAGGPA